MKKLFLTLVTALVVAGTAHAQPVIGQPAPGAVPLGPMTGI